MNKGWYNSDRGVVHGLIQKKLFPQKYGHVSHRMTWKQTIDFMDLRDDRIIKKHKFEYMMRAVALLMEVDQKFRISIIDKF